MDVDKLSELDKLPVWAQIAIGSPLFVVSAWIVIKNFFKEMRRPEPGHVVLEHADLADGSPIRAIAPGLQRLYEVQTDIDGKLDRIGDNLETVIDLLRERMRVEEIDRAVREDREMRARVRGGIVET